MLNHAISAADHYRASWKSARIAEFHSLLDSTRSVSAAIEIKHNEITALRQVVGESARTVSRTRPHACKLSGLIETISATTSPCHLGTARSIALKLQQILDEAIASLRNLPESEGAEPIPLRTLGGVTEEALLHSRKISSLLVQMMANADEEVRTLQAAFLALSASERRSGQ